MVGVHGMGLLYAVKDGSGVWVPTFATGADELAGRRPALEQAAKSLRRDP